MEQPDVGIIIPCFNAERYIGPTVLSALGQDLSRGPCSLEVIVVDDGSTDRSADIVAQVASVDSRLRLVRQSNSGVATARNLGLASCSPSVRFVLFLDADDLLLPDAAECLRGRLQSDPTFVAAVGACQHIDAAGAWISRSDNQTAQLAVREVSDGSVTVVSRPDRIGYWHLLPVTPISTPGQVLVRRDALPPDGPFDPSTVPCEDWDLWLRLARQGDFGVIPHPVLMYRDHPEGASKQYRLMKCQRETVLQRQRSLVPADELENLRAAWRFAMYRFDAGLCRKWAAECLADHNVVGALRYALRGMRFTARLMTATALGRPQVAPDRAG